MMKWSQEWLSNQDCNGDGLLDRGFSCDPNNANNSACPGAWLTNHERGVYYDNDGKKQRYEYFVKIITPPADANSTGNVWYAADGTEIGPAIWGGFAIVQEIYNDTGSGDHGVLYKSPYSVGFGTYTPQNP